MKGKKLFLALLPAIVILLVGFVVAAVIYFLPGEKTTYDVVFCDENNEVVATVKANEGEPVKAPDIQPKQNAVFKGWSVDLSNVTQDMEARPLYTDLSKDVNAFAFAPVLAYLSKASPSSFSNILCSRKWATPAGMSYFSPFIIKLLSTEPKFVAKTACTAL